MVRSHLVIAGSNFIFSHINENYNEFFLKKNKKLLVIFRGINLSYFDPKKIVPSKIEKFLKKNNIDRNKFIILLPGRLTTWKGQKIFIEALKQLNTKENIQSFTAIILGSDQGRTVYKKQLLSIQTKSDTSNLFAEEYLIKRPLLKALTSEVDNLLLIDEIDRADEEFEALLLEILAENQITIPEMGTITGKENKVIILTSNNTRELSDALRRRCIYLYLDFPNIEIEKKVLMNTVEGISEDEAIKYKLIKARDIAI